MRTAIIVMVFIALFVFGNAPVFAAEGDTGTQPQAATSTEVPDLPACGDMQEYTCPNCGKTFSLGRRGESGETVKCPYCGCEVCKEEKGISLGADAGFFSKYVSRGLNYTDAPVFQPDVWASYKGFTLSIWGSMDLTDKNRLSGDFSEFDYTLDYSNCIGPLSYSGGAIYYNYLNTSASDTAEVYAGIGYDILLKPKLVVYYDFWQADGFYGVASIRHSFELPEFVKGIKSSVDLSAQVGLGSRNNNEFNFGGDKHTAFTDYLLTAAIPVSLTDVFSIKPTVSYSSVLDRTIRTKSRLNDNMIYGGVVSASF